MKATTGTIARTIIFFITLINGIFAIIGCIFTIFGVYLCNTHKKVIEKYKK